MKRISFFVVFTIFILSLIACSHNPTKPDEGILRDLTASEKKLTESDNRFGLKIFQQINSQEGNKNIFISPLSISMALGMAYNGAEGNTKEQMRQVLEYDDLNDREINESYKSLIELLSNLDPKVIFNIANSIWYRDGFEVEDEFINLNTSYFDAVVRELNFSDEGAADIINDWVSENTKDKIKEIVEKPINPLTIMFIINAIYFKGTWTYEFDEEYTTDDKFYLSDGSQITCEMMHQKCDLGYFENDDFQVVDLPYGDEQYSMTVFLPKPGRDIDSLITDITDENWNRWLSFLSTQEVNLYLPKFKLEYYKKLNYDLQALGMTDAFGNADFTRITKDGEIYISDVKHKSFIDVNEEGTEAAAVTVIEFRVESVEDSPTVMRIDRPFLFAIRENSSGTILFIGKIVEPAYDND